MTQKCHEYAKLHNIYMEGQLTEEEESELLEKMDDIWYSLTPQERVWCEMELAPAKIKL